jgi:hypothetical protein
MGRLGPDPDCAVIGSTEGEWIKLRVAVELTGMESADQTNTLYGYVDRQTLEANMEPVSERASGAILREKLGEKIDDAVNLDRRFPVWVAVLLVLNLVVAGMPDKRAGLRLALGYITLVAAFALELLYIALLEEKFWWCEPDQVGWLKAILFFIVTLVLAVYQFFSFFNLLNQINERSRPFNTYVGITLFTLVTVVMFVYAIFTGGLNDRQNLILIYILVGTQALQMLISAVQLRRHPLYALMVLLLIPLGTFAVLLSFLRLFAILCFLALLGLVFFSMASGRGAPLSAGKKEEDPAKTFTQAGPNMIRDGNGVEYRKVPYDYSSTHPGEKVEHFGGDKYVRK